MSNKIRVRRCRSQVEVGLSKSTSLIFKTGGMTKSSEELLIRSPEERRRQCSFNGSHQDTKVSGKLEENSFSQVFLNRVKALEVGLCGLGTGVHEDGSEVRKTIREE
jgi:hypothetical protein